MRTKHLTRTGALNIVAQVVLLAALYAVGHEQPMGGQGFWRDVSLIGLVFVHSAIWVAFFYLQDRAEPEPAAYVLAAFVAGMAAASLIALPAEQTLFRLSSWMYRSEVSLILGATCVLGAVASLLFYAIIRYGFVPAREFDEPVDGMAYGAFVGCGFATVLSLTYLAIHPDFTLFAVAVSAATNVLVYASVGSLVGYLVGRAKFQARPVGAAHAVAIIGGAVLVGLYHVLVEYAFLRGSSQSLWAGAIVAVAFAIVVLGSATALMYRLTSRETTAASVAPMRPIDPLAIGAGIVLLAAGAYAAFQGTRPVVFRDARYAISFAYDPIVTVAGGSDVTAAVTQAAFAAHGSTGLPLIFSARAHSGAMIVVQEASGIAPLDQLDPRRFLRSAEPMEMTISDVSIGGRHGLRMRYAYLLKSAGFSRELPRMRWVYTDVVPAAEDTYAISFDAAPEAFNRDEPLYSAVLSTVSWSNK